MDRKSNSENPIYKGSLALLTDYYQITMAYAYWKANKADQKGVFHLFFRKNPFAGGYTIACGLEYVIDYIENFSFQPSDLDYLRNQTDASGLPVFDEGFIEYLENLRFTCDIKAMPEGTICFPNEPMLRISGPLLQCQLLETPLLNIINFQSLIATKAARICQAAQDDPVMEFGLRRAQGMDGGLAASRAAYIGGCASTSNVLAGKLFGIPVSGTHAHSWILSFPTEKEAFEEYAKAFPENSLFLVDTFDTLEGVRKAIAVADELKKIGKTFKGIRIDSGDLAYFSQRARLLLDEAGYPNAKIVASNDLDEYIIHSLKKEQNAAIDIWGVGTKLITAFDQPALGAVYKLSALQEPDGTWVDKIKLSEQSIKINNPGMQQCKRYFSLSQGIFVGDMIFDERDELAKQNLMIDPADATRSKTMGKQGLNHVDLLEDIYQDGELIYQKPSLLEIRDRVQTQLKALDPTIKRFINPHIYTVGLEQQLHHRKNELIINLRKTN
ncbi:nicotinate phosphoribosyltransferase [Peijinzhouia sedimentorum]